MLKQLIFSLFLLLIFFTGCANKTDIKKVDIKKEQIISEDEELDEFSDEFEEETQERADPLKEYNIFMTDFNDGFYIHVFDPVARGYNFVVPKPVRKGIKNFFNNILYPIRLINNLFQGKVENAGEETGRFIINTTIGIFGLFDPAQSYFNLKPHNEDFGQTLGYWGVGSGYHIVLPFLGPSNMRDMFSLYPDSLASPIDYQSNRSYNLTSNYDKSLGLRSYEILNKGSLRLGEYEALKKDAIQLYPFLRDIYEQYRDKQIKE